MSSGTANQSLPAMRRGLVADVPQKAVDKRGLTRVHASHDIHPFGVLHAAGPQSQKGLGRT